MTGTAPDTATDDTVAAGRKGRALFRIQTFTGRYDPVEDRLRLDAVDAQGGKQAIFLTRRLVDRVIPVLVSHLEGKTPEGVPADLAQGMSQSRARQARQTGEATPAIAADPETPTWLCRTMHFQKADHGLNVIFTDDTQVNAVMPMVEANLRAVLDIFLDLYTKAGWPTEPFPEWQKPEATVTLSPAPGTRLN
jgi:hypothetical protein